MANKSPNPDNYTLGRGIIYFSQDDGSGGFTGELDLGNAPDFSTSVDVERLEHFSSRSGLRSKDKNIVAEITPRLSFTLDEINVENMQLLFMANAAAVTQVLTAVSGGPESHAITALEQVKNRVYDVGGDRKIGYLNLPIGTVTGGPFVRGETITGGTSSTTANVAYVGSTFLLIDTVSGSGFTDAETITGGTSAATAPVSSTNITNYQSTGAFFDSASVVLLDGSTPQTLTTDFTVQDANSGLIKIPETTTIVDGTALTIEYMRQAASWTKLDGFEQTDIEGKLRFVSDPPAGQQFEVIIHRASLTPTGDTAFIGDDFTTLGFDGEILRDETNNPQSPFMDIIVT